ncbi:transcription factor A, mitochondrial isoform X2 [Drosophila teissieri]|uniref:transcription factor A, mitochondrial isoform X2 n=1 Tax=Drosophila santomea TaxID=129105 RepID=UPI001953A0E6|nr:transcription factor A, mitochondrial isoform X2 [Drosophila santomea]XP_043651316.1 transcription factor A, mitochondrial isoform X2 [Drosophila teissieri]XP_043862190.1 transcription factor A, mitochondrial isoform X2 [Drosophila santomea]
MIYTTTLMSSRGGLIGSLINKVRPLAAASISNTPVVPSKTLEEQVGLPPRPKKPLTPYFRFMREQRPKLKAANPQITTVEVVRQLSKSWSDVDAQLKERLQAEFKRDQQIYLEQRTKYDATLTEEQRAEIKQLKQDIVEAKERRQLRKRVKELGRPKKPASAFLRFIASERTNTPQGAKQTYREWHQKTTAKWTRLSDSEKEVYMQESRQEMELYRKSISVWEEKMIRLGHIDVVRHGNLIDPPEPKPRKTLPPKEK